MFSDSVSAMKHTLVLCVRVCVKGLKRVNVFLLSSVFRSLQTQFVTLCFWSCFVSELVDLLILVSIDRFQLISVPKQSANL